MFYSYNTDLVILSVVVALMASYAALDLSSRVSQTQGRASLIWLSAGACAMGGGIWSMHFIAMLAFRLPIKMAYDFQITALSLLIVILTSGFALAVVSRKQLGTSNLLAGGVLMGTGICGMHYTGMAAMRMFPAIQYDLLLLAASIVIATSASIAALWLAFTLRAGTSSKTIAAKLLSAVVMGAAISGMHYTAMAAANLDPSSVSLAAASSHLSHETLGYSVFVLIFAILGMTLTATAFDVRTEQTRRTEEYFRALLDMAPDAMIVIDSAGIITLVNIQAEHFFGYARGEMLGQPIELLIPERFRTAHAGHRSSYFAKPKIRPMGAGLELWGRRKDGSEFPIEISLSPMKSEGQAFATAAVRDITDRKAAEVKLAGYSQKLKQSNEELEQFAYATSHDLQAPLRSIVSFTELLRSQYGDRLDDKGREFMDFIVQGGTQMQALIKDLLAFSRVGRMDTEVVPCDSEAILGQVIGQLASLIEDRHATITHDPLPVVCGTPHELNQLFQNLIVNAIKFQPGDAPRVHITAKRDGDMWKFSVRDWGIGIKPEYQAKIFQIFQRLHASGAYEGTGIGLALCQKIVARHGGSIWVKSEPGQGSTFYFTLRDVDAAPGQGSVPVSPPDGGS